MKYSNNLISERTHWWLPETGEEFKMSEGNQRYNVQL